MYTVDGRKQLSILEKERERGRDRDRADWHFHDAAWVGWQSSSLSAMMGVDLLLAFASESTASIGQYGNSDLSEGHASRNERGMNAALARLVTTPRLPNSTERLFRCYLNERLLPSLPSIPGPPSPPAVCCCVRSACFSKNKNNSKPSYEVVSLYYCCRHLSFAWEQNFHRAVPSTLSTHGPARKARACVSKFPRFPDVGSCLVALPQPAAIQQHLDKSQKQQVQNSTQTHTHTQDIPSQQIYRQPELSPTRASHLIFT